MMYRNISDAVDDMEGMIAFLNETELDPILPHRCDDVIRKLRQSRFLWKCLPPKAKMNHVKFIVQKCVSIANVKVQVLLDWRAAGLLRSKVECLNLLLKLKTATKASNLYDVCHSNSRDFENSIFIILTEAKSPVPLNSQQQVKINQVRRRYFI